jgi:hypothetical protein
MVGSPQPRPSNSIRRILPSTWPFFIALLIAGAVLVPASSQPPSSRALEVPAIVVIPDSGPAGTAVQINGSGFSPGAALVVSFVQAPTVIVQGTILSLGDGTFSANRIVPPEAVPGGAEFVVTNLVISSESASDDFTVTDPEEPCEPDCEPPPPPPPGRGRPQRCTVTLTLKTFSVTFDTEFGQDEWAVHAISTGLGASTTPTFFADPEDGRVEVNHVVAHKTLPVHAFALLTNLQVSVREIDPAFDDRGRNFGGPLNLLSCPQPFPILEVVSIGIEDGAPFDVVMVFEYVVTGPF